MVVQKHIKKNQCQHDEKFVVSECQAPVFWILFSGFFFISSADGGDEHLFNYGLGPVSSISNERRYFSLFPSALFILRSKSNLSSHDGL